MKFIVSQAAKRFNIFFCEMIAFFYDLCYDREKDEGDVYETVYS